VNEEDPFSISRKARLRVIAVGSRVVARGPLLRRTREQEFWTASSRAVNTVVRRSGETATSRLAAHRSSSFASTAPPRAPPNRRVTEDHRRARRARARFGGQQCDEPPFMARRPIAHRPWREARAPPAGRVIGVVRWPGLPRAACPGTEIAIADAELRVAAASASHRSPHSNPRCCDSSRRCTRSRVAPVS